MCGNDHSPTEHGNPVDPSDPASINRARNDFYTGDITIERVKHLLGDKLGTCDFYRVLSDLTPGDRADGYYWNYGYKYCIKFSESSLNKDPKAARWLDCVRVNLQREILNHGLVYGDNLEKTKEFAFGTHAKVYTNCGICELDKTLIQQLRVLFIPDADDLWTPLGFQQMKETLRRCFFRPILFSTLVSEYRSWGDLKEDRLGKDLAQLAKEDPIKNYKTILGIMEMLSHTLNDDDVAQEFMKALSNQELDDISKSPDGRRTLFMMKSALQSGFTSRSESKQLSRIGDKARR